MHNVVLQFRWYGFHTSRNVCRRFPRSRCIDICVVNVNKLSCCCFYRKLIPSSVDNSISVECRWILLAGLHVEFSQFNYDYHWIRCVCCDGSSGQMNSLDIRPLSVSWWLDLIRIIGDSPDTLHLGETHSNSVQLNVPKFSVSLGNYGKMVTLIVR